MKEEPANARKSFGDLAPQLAEITDKVLFGDVWEQAALPPRDRSLVTVTSLIALYRTNEMPFHFKKALENGLTREEIIGTAEIRTVFVASKIGTVAGSYITSGMVHRNAKFRLLRENVVIYTGEVESLRRLKDDVKDVKEGFECGIKLKNYNDVKEGDQLEFFDVKEIARTL